MRLQQLPRIKFNLEFESLLEAREKIIEVLALIDTAEMEMNQYLQDNDLTHCCKVYGGNIIWNSTAYTSETALHGLLQLQEKHFDIIHKRINR